MKTRVDWGAGIAGMADATAAATLTCSLSTQAEVRRHERKALCFGNQNDLGGRSIKYHFQKILLLPLLLLHLFKNFSTF